MDWNLKGKTSLRVLMVGCVAAIALSQLRPVEEPYLPPDQPVITMTAEETQLSPESLPRIASTLDQDWARAIATLAPRANAEELLELGVTEEHVDHLVSEYVRRKPNIFVAVVSPRAERVHTQVKDLLNKFGRVVHSKPIPLSSHAARSLLIKMYDELSDHPHKWVKREAAIQKHLRSRFGVADPAWLIVFEAPSLAHTKAWKRYIRRTTGIGTTGLHVTDTHHEAVVLTELLLNPNAIEILNSARKKTEPTS